MEPSSQVLAKRIADRVALILQEKGLRQADLARASGISQPTVSRAMRGGYWSVELLLAAARLCGVTTDHLLGR